MARKTDELPGKSGVKSLSKKLGATRYGFDEHPGASKTPGAFGKEEHEPRAHESGSGSTRKSKTDALDRLK